MRSIFVALAVAISFANAYAETPTPADGTTSVLKAVVPTATAPVVQSPTTATAPVVQSPTTATAPVVQAQVISCEEAKVVKLAPWQVRRLNRVADRQEAREARKCCDPCSCKKDDCCQKSKTLVLESRRKEKCDCCCK